MEGVVCPTGVIGHNTQVILDFIERAILEPLRADPETQRLLQEHGKDFDRHLLSTVLDQGRRASDSLLTARYYAYLYMLVRHDGIRHVFGKNRDLFQRGILDQNGNLLIADFGCGPMNMGIALAALMNEAVGVPLDARYIGIDINEHVKELAKEFESFSAFSPGFQSRYEKSWDVDAVPDLVTFANGAKGIVFFFSFFFGQILTSDDLDSLAKYCKTILTKLQPEHATLIYLNSVHNDAGPNWVEFANRMDISPTDERDNFDFRIFLGLNSKPKEFHNTKLRPSLAHSVVSLDWRRYA